MTQTAASSPRAWPRSPPFFAALIVSGCGINNIPTYENSAKAAWSEVLNQYKRRSDLIANLVKTVKGFAEQEKSVLTEVTEARAKATQAQVQVPARHPDQSRCDKAVSGRAEQSRRRARPPAGRDRALSRHQIGPELPRAAKRACRYRKPHRDFAARLHRIRARL